MQVKIIQSQHEIYKQERLLGEGAFGKAYLVRKKETNELLVIKQMNIEHMSQAEREETIKEAQILRSFNHPGIVRFVEVYATKQNKLKIVMEYAECGDVSKAIAARRTQKKNFEESHILDWFTQICLAIKHVHDRKILHRDIKGQNIFITNSNTLKLGDFGIARVLNRTQDKARTVVGTPYYLSPEIIENKPYSFKSDIWSMGVVLYELCALQPPFTATSLQMLALKIVKGCYPPIQFNYSRELKSLVGELLQVDANRRPNVGDILKRPLIQDRIRKFLSETLQAKQFSHTVLHNQRVEISNKLVKMQENKVRQEGKKQDLNYEAERIKLKEDERLLLLKRLERKREEDRLKEERAKQERAQEDERKKAEEAKEQKRKEEEKRRREEERKRMIEKERIKQEEFRRDYEEKERRRMLELEHELQRRKEALMQEKLELERKMAIKKKKEKELQQEKKMDQFNELARKQYFENQMIRKMAEERAKLSEQGIYEEPVVRNLQPPLARGTSEAGNQKARPMLGFVNRKRNSLAKQPSQEELENVFVDPNFVKRPSLSQNRPENTPRNEERQKPDKVDKVEKDTRDTRETKDTKEGRETKETKDTTQKRNYNEMREQMKRDKQQFHKQKLEAGSARGEEAENMKWAKKGSVSKEKQIDIERQDNIVSDNIISDNINSDKKEQSEKKTQSGKKTQSDKRNQPTQIVPLGASMSLLDSSNLRISTKGKEEFGDYLQELVGILEQVNRNIEPKQGNRNIDPKQGNRNIEPNIILLTEFPVEQEIVFRDDDYEQLSFSKDHTMNILEPELNQEEPVDFDYFSNYSKLETLRINLEELFGTTNFITLYRVLEKELDEKGLEGFDIGDITNILPLSLDAKLVNQNLTLLLTLIAMESKMSAV